MFSTKYVMICPCLVLKELAKQALALSLNVSSKFRHYDIFEREMFAAGKAADFQLRSCCCRRRCLPHLPSYLPTYLPACGVDGWMAAAAVKGRVGLENLRALSYLTHRGLGCRKPYTVSQMLLCQTSMPLERNSGAHVVILGGNCKLN